MPVIARLVSLGVILTLIIFFGITFYKVITPYMMPLFLAVITAILCQPMYKFFLKRSKGNTAYASLLSTMTVIAGVMLPLVFGISTAAYQMTSINVDSLVDKMHEVREKVDLEHWITEYNLQDWIPSEQEPPDSKESVANEQTETPKEETTPPKSEDSETALSDTEESQVELDSDQLKTKAKAEKKVDELFNQTKTQMEASLKWIGEKSFFAAGAVFSGAGAVFSGIGSVMIAILIYTMALYYFFVDGPALLDATQKLVPVHLDHQNELLSQFQKVIRSIILATLAAAISQGLVTAGIMTLTGSGHFFLLFGISSMFAMIPMLGTWVVWSPFAIYLFVQGDWVAGSILTFVGVVVVGMMDNVIRTWILKDGARLHPLLAFVSVLGGLQVMGLWGVFIGPTVASCLYALVKIFNVELHSLSQEQFGPVKLVTPGAGEMSSDEVANSVKNSASVSNDKTPNTEDKASESNTEQKPE